MNPEQFQHALAARNLATPWLLVHATNGFVGRLENDPIYQTVVERRDSGAMQKSYSSCGDLAHWFYARQGIRAPWLNRAELGQYRNGQNISLLQSMNPLAAARIDPAGFAAGDVLLIWSEQHRPDANGRDTYGNDAHCIVVAGDLQNNVLPTAEYGQPGGKYCMRSPTQYGAHWLIGSRQIQRRYSFELLLQIADAKVWLGLPDLALLNSIAPGDVVDDIENELRLALELRADV